MTGIDISAITRLRHTALWELSNRLGGQIAAAEQIGVSASTFNHWVQLTLCFPSRPKQGWKKDRWTQVKENLESLTGQTIDDLFPESLRKAVKLRAFVGQVEQVIEVPEEALLAYASNTTERLRLPEPIAAAENNELRDGIKQALKKLSSRQQDIIALRFGLDGNEPKTLREVGKITNLSAARVLQIENKAVRRLRNLDSSNKLMGFLD